MQLKVGSSRSLTTFICRQLCFALNKERKNRRMDMCYKRKKSMAIRVALIFTIKKL